MSKKISIAPNELMLVHVSRDEANMFDEMQGGANLVQVGDNQIRSYENLLPVFNDPKVRDFFENIAQNLKVKRKVRNNKFLNKLDQYEEEKNTPSPDILGPDGQQIASLGEAGDDDIVLMPVAILDYFDATIGKPQLNKTTGLPQYNEFGKRAGEWIRANPGKSFTDYLMAPGVLAFQKTSNNPLVNFRNDVLKPIAKNPIGQVATQLAIAAATGGMSLPAQLAAQAATAAAVSRTAGNKWNNVLKDAAIAGITHGAGHVASGYGAGAGMKALTKGATHYGTTAALGRPTSLLKSALTGGGDYALSGMTRGLGAGVAAGSETAGGTGALTTPALGFSASPGAASALSAAQLPAAALSAAPSAGSGIMSMLGGIPEALGISPLAAAGIGGAGMLLYKGHLHQQKMNNQARERERAEKMQANQDIMNQMQNYGGFTEPLAENLEYPMTVPTESGAREPLVRNPRRPTQAEIMMGLERQFYIPKSQAQNYKKGGVVSHAAIKGLPREVQFIQGPGGGQDDRIPFDYVRNGDFIWDASSTSNLGDGSANEGYGKLNQLLAHIRARKDHIPTESHDQLIPAALSDSEIKIPAEDVDRIGNGSNKRGSDILNKMREQLRADKIKNGLKLPHKAKNIFHYYKNAGGSI